MRTSASGALSDRLRAAGSRMRASPFLQGDSVCWYMSCVIDCPWHHGTRSPPSPQRLWTYAGACLTACPLLLPRSPPLAIIETDASVPKAAEVIKCQVCQHFVEEAAKVGFRLMS